MDPKGKGMVVNDKEEESIFNEPRDDKPTDSGSSHKKRDGKKKRHIKKLFWKNNQKVRARWTMHNKKKHRKSVASSNVKSMLRKKNLLLWNNKAKKFPELC